jgi:hypothetical protein
MVPRTAVLALALACLFGCTSGRLRQRTINQGKTLPELQYQQVLDNLALFAANPSALPWHVNLREGTTQITDSLSGGAAVDLGPPTETLPQILGSRTVVAQWGMSPVIDVAELRLLRIAYRRAHGLPDMPDAEFLDELAQELKDQSASNSDLRDESELFFEYQSAAHKNYDSFDAAVRTTTRFAMIPKLPRPRSLRSQGMYAARSEPSSGASNVSGPVGSMLATNEICPKTLAMSVIARTGTSGLARKAAMASLSLP